MKKSLLKINNNKNIKKNKILMEIKQNKMINNYQEWRNLEIIRKIWIVMEEITQVLSSKDNKIQVRSLKLLQNPQTLNMIKNYL